MKATRLVSVGWNLSALMQITLGNVLIVRMKNALRLSLFDGDRVSYANHSRAGMVYDCPDLEHLG